MSTEKDIKDFIDFIKQNTELMSLLSGQDPDNEYSKNLNIFLKNQCFLYINKLNKLKEDL